MNTTPPVVEARRAHSSRCRQRVIKALNDAVANGEEISVSSIARAAGVDRSFFYRHRDLHTQVMAKAAELPISKITGPAVSRASLLADLANANERIARLTHHNQQLQRRLSELLGEQAWQQSGLGAPPDTAALQRRITELEQANVETRRVLAEREEDLEAARATNRELMTNLNRPHARP
jgi:hypothetical protein